MPNLHPLVALVTTVALGLSARALDPPALAPRQPVGGELPGLVVRVQPDSLPRATLQSEPVGAGLFAYRPHPGEKAAFEEGYRAHLDWHARAGDSLSWFGWEVLAGPGLGLFVDGVFGVPFRALDQRVDPAGDRADLAANIGDHATPAFRTLLRLRPELGTATPLEEGRSTPLVEAVTYDVAPGGTPAVEAALRALRTRATDDDSLLPYTVYERVTGTGAPGYLVLIWRESWSSFQREEADPDRVLRRQMLGAGRVPAGSVGSRTTPASSVEAVGPLTAVRRELWVFRPDLTRIVTGGDGP